jgi:hypothetical protein
MEPNLASDAAASIPHEQQLSPTRFRQHVQHVHLPLGYHFERPVKRLGEVLRVRAARGITEIHGRVV